MNAARFWLALAGVYGFLAVALGAFGAHALRARLSPEMSAVWHVGVQYQFYHLLALFGVGLLMLWRPAPGQTLAAACFALGILLFSGSLYALALSDVRALGAVTPFGGVLLLVGWVALVWSILRG